MTNVIQHPDAENLAALLETSGDGEVFLAGCRITRRMIMHEDNCSRIRQACRLEYLAWMHDGLVK